MVSPVNPAQAITFRFDRIKHIYTLDGAEIPSVTQVLREAGFYSYNHVPADVLAAKCDLGTKVHLACELLDQNDLDMASVHPLIAPYVAAYEKFRRESGFRPILVEHSTYFTHKGMPVGMTLDRLGELNGDLFVLDIKTAANKEPWWRVQLAAYVMGLTLANPQDKPIEPYRRASLMLRKDATYALETYNSPNDELAFQCALGVAYFKRGRL